MAVSDRAAVPAPYLGRLLYDEEAQDAVRRVVAGTRDAYGRVRGKSARRALEDKKFRHRLQQAVRAVVEFWCVIAESSPWRNRRWGRGLVVLALGASGECSSRPMRRFARKCWLCSAGTMQRS